MAPLAALLSAFLYYAAFPPIGLAEAAYVCWIPLLLWLSTWPSWRQVALWGWIAGLLSWGALLIWLPAFSRHLGFAGSDALGWLAWVLLAAVMGIFPAIWALGCRMVLPGSHQRGGIWRVLALLSIGFLWVMIEWVREWLLTGFPWLPLAASQWERPLILQVSSIFGAKSVSFVLITFNVALVFYILQLSGWRSKKWWQRVSVEFYTGFALLAGCVAYGLQSFSTMRPVEPVFSALVVQPDIAAPEKWDAALVEEVYDIIEGVTRLGSYLEPDIILWPEATTPYPVFPNGYPKHWIESLSRELELPILAGSVIVDTDPGNMDAAWWNGVVYADPQEGIDLDRFYAKRHLVPFGEYIPFTRWLPFLDKVIPLPGDFAHGTEPSLIDIPWKERVLSIGPLVCFEDVFPSLARSSVRAGADLLFVSTNNAWFGEGAAAYQHAAHSVLRAVEMRRPVLRCGNAGWSGWIDEFGYIRHVAMNGDGDIYYRGADTMQISRSRYWVGRLSSYARHGDVWIFPGFTCFLIAAFFLRRQRSVKEAEGG